MKKHGVVVIGGGSGGYAAARTAHEAGADRCGGGLWTAVRVVYSARLYAE